MIFKDQDKYALEAIKSAAKTDELFLAKCENCETGEVVTTLCSRMPLGEDSFMLVPLAQCFKGNPFEELKPVKTEAEEDAA